VLDEAKQREVCALISAGCSIQAAASYVGCAPNTIRREIDRNSKFGQRYREARLQAQLSPLQALENEKKMKRGHSTLENV
jgi:IS30 family transposase